MAVWETDDETDGPILPVTAALPTPADTPYRTRSRPPSRTPSRTSKKSRRSTTPPRPATSPPPIPGTDKTDKTDKSSKRSSRDLAFDDTISILDPRRFTPTLHANLVSEILSLRRDQEEKVKIIESLEAALQTSREEQDALQDAVATTSKENRQVKRQLALLEGGTSTALSELTRERDEAAETINETKKRLEATQKRLRHCEEDSEQTHKQWAREKDAWDEERRKLERKVHVADTRLKAVIDEVAAFQAAEMNATNGNNSTESEAEEMAAGKEADSASVRTMSPTSSIRFSVMSGKLNSHSLADELNFDGDDDYETDTGRESVLSNHFHVRNPSRDSLLNRAHRRNQSNDSVRRPGSVVRGRFLNQSVLERLEGVIIREVEEEQQIPVAEVPVVPVVPKVEYTDSAVQYSPPPSPKLLPQTLLTIGPISEVSVEPSVEIPVAQTPPPIPSRADRISLSDATFEMPTRGEWVEIEANQRRKRVHIARTLTIEPVTMSSSLMVSVGSQTSTEMPLTPPKTPKSPPFERGHSKTRTSPGSPAESLKPAQAVLVSASTQTDPPSPPATPLATLSPMGLVPLGQMPIPIISIHPPTSRPTTPHEPLLPPLFKDFGCQVQLAAPSSYTSTSVQTDEIRVDKRLDRLPAHLHPSAITSRPSSPGAFIVDPAAAAVDDLSSPNPPAPGYVPPRNPKRLTARISMGNEPSSPPTQIPLSPISLETHDAYPGNNDDGPLSNQRAPMRRPHRISSLFAGFDAISSDEADEFMDGDLSDLEFQTALSAPKPQSGSSSTRTNVKRSGGLASDTTSPEQPVPLPRRSSSRNTTRSSMMGIGSAETYGRLPLREANQDSRDPVLMRRQSIKGSRLSYDKPSSRSNGMRKAAMIQSGIATHQGRSRSPSVTEVADPPFPIPTRASSRKPPVSVSAPSDGQRSPTREAWAPRRTNSRGGNYRANSIRKVRSAAAIPVKPRHGRRASRSPPRHVPFSADDEEPESPGLPPLPNNDFTATSRAHYRSHRHQMSTTTTTTDVTGSSGNQTTGVVDAIAQTMVGEWMYKYVRRRKSFGGADVSNRDDSSNDRHKRWVWLAPYERAILWSSKQPSNNSMLMGKSGRKLTIQSVLDVKDDNAPPKGCAQLFNRSILILTPQRALKFTATTPERHYLWLTSLSFLAHSQQAVPENIAMPLPKTAPDFELPRPKRRNGIRDSIRLTKSKGALVQSSLAGASIAVPALPPPPPPMSVASSQTDSMPPSIPSYRPAESTVSAPSVAPSISTHQRDISRDTAEPPVIARYHDRSNNTAMVHGRKRSNTGGHVPPPLSFRGFSGPAGSSSSYHQSTNSTAGQSDISQSQASTNVTWGMVNGATALSSQRTSEASSRPSGPVMNNFFDAIGTVRMEAFISPLAMPQFDEYPGEQEEVLYRARRRSKDKRRRASRSRHRDSYTSRGTRGTDDLYAGSRTGGDEDYFRDDPFRGF
ncbi:nuclear migration protein [Grosmannia clavigera kw1407]|uniref:Nuclear migration protein n=1 Tax=Grosmannia clavigera (strain kw1407 / UAMH 11150) TaxID=655863 RepID=F0XFV6_GROCL|nr:nuclear migration protein [Grosmannia clavigera kw1407]EFX03546.1 nuclear migration protein [Grosmannia clavigera kw1407]